jgi:flagellar hook-basal body complex protein FliE
MSDIKITGINQTGGITQPGAAKASDSPGGFDRVMDEVLGKLSQVQIDAEKATTQLVNGGDITQAIIAMQQADMNFQLMVEVRNKLIAAYEEIMRMQV